MISEVERLQAEAALNDIAVRKAVLFQKYRGSIEPEPEYFGQMQALDNEAVFWREKLDDTPTPAILPPWGKELWTTVNYLRFRVDDFRDERRRERLEDANDRDHARRVQYTLFSALLVLQLAIAVALLVVLK